MWVITSSSPLWSISIATPMAGIEERLKAHWSKTGNGPQLEVRNLSDSIKRGSVESRL